MLKQETRPAGPVAPSANAEPTGRRRLFRDPAGGLPHLLALTYSFGGFGLALALLILGSHWLTVPATLLLAHALVIAAYLIHECAHNTVFTDNRWNARLGEALMWLTGAAYGRYEDVRHKHFRHHIDRADVVAFDFRRFLPRYPRLFKLIQALEWLYVPAVDLLMHALVIVIPFRLASRRDRRVRVLAVLATRAAFFGLLGFLSLKALLLYTLAYLLFLHVMRFMDVHQHTYEVWETLERPRGREDERFDREYEHRNTYSNPISLAHPWLNLLTLNFGYHNAHHVKPTVPWYRLPGLHRELYGDDRRQVLSFRNLLASYHRHRVPRIVNGDVPDMDVGDGRNFVGVVGVSFLTAH